MGGFRALVPVFASYRGCRSVPVAAGAGLSLHGGTRCRDEHKAQGRTRDRAEGNEAERGIGHKEMRPNAGK